MVMRLKRMKVPTPLLRVAQAISVVSAAVKLYGFGLGAIAAGVVVALVRGLLHGWALTLLVAGVVLVVAAASITVIERRRRRIWHEQCLEHTTFMKVMTSIRRRGSNIYLLPREQRPPLDWRAALVRAGRQHLAFLDRVKGSSRGTTDPDYLRHRQLLVDWCADMFKFASAAGIDHTRFRDFPTTDGWDGLDRVRAVIVHNIAELESLASSQSMSA
jgi:hypothetical protein